MSRHMFRDPKTNDVYEYDDAQVAGGFVRDGLSRMGDADISDHLRPPVSIEQQRATLRLRLSEIDAASARPLRAILVGSATDADYARLTELDNQAAALRAELAALPA